MKRIVFILSVFLSCHVFAAVRMPELKWSVSYSADKQLSQGKEIPAIVPGAVQLDIARAENIHPMFLMTITSNMVGWKICITPIRLSLKNRFYLHPNVLFCFKRYRLPVRNIFERRKVILSGRNVYICKSRPDRQAATR